MFKLSWVCITYFDVQRKPFMFALIDENFERQANNSKYTREEINFAFAIFIFQNQETDLQQVLFL